MDAEQFHTETSQPTQEFDDEVCYKCLTCFQLFKIKLLSKRISKILFTLLANEKYDHYFGKRK